LGERAAGGEGGHHSEPPPPAAAAALAEELEELEGWEKVRLRSSSTRAPLQRARVSSLRELRFMLRLRGELPAARICEKLRSAATLLVGMLAYHIPRSERGRVMRSFLRHPSEAQNCAGGSSLSSGGRLGQAST